MTDLVKTSSTDRLISNGDIVPLSEAVKVWARVAALSFGGPAGQIAVMYRIVVNEKRWVGEHRILHALNYCMPARSRSSSACHLHRLAAQQDQRRHDRRLAVRPARLRLDPGAELHLCPIRRPDSDRGDVLRIKVRGARRRYPGRMSVITTLLISAGLGVAWTMTAS